MDLVRELKDVRFELALRGYDCEAVDAFLARLQGDIAGLQEANEGAAARIAELERAVQEGGGSGETEGTLRRTLVLAQRLADETEAESKKAAADLIDGATAEAEQMRSSAEVESRSMRDEAKRELDNAREEAAGIRETVAEESARERAKTRVASERILAESERRGMERVASLEQAAQIEVAKMREPIRAEVTELEEARARVLGDISALETHLEQQRIRVRTAVEALRVGMSGSIEDLERVAEDDDLIATQPAPDLSGASADDVGVAPDVEIIDEVARTAPPAPTTDDIEDDVAAELTEAAIASETVDPDGFDDVAEAVTVEDVVAVDQVVEEIVVEDIVVVEEATVVVEAGNASFDEPVVDSFETIDVVSDAEIIDEGPATEPIPVVDASSIVDGISEYELTDESPVVELDDEPTALFGTDLSADADVAELADEADRSEEDVNSADESAAGVGFVDRFAELLDSQPVGRDH